VGPDGGSNTGLMMDNNEGFDQDELDHIQQWMRHLQAKCEQFSNMPICPFAKLTDNSAGLGVTEITCNDNPHAVLIALGEAWEHKPHRVTVIIDRTGSSLDEMVSICDSVNCALHSRGKDVVVMTDFVAKPLVIGGVETGNGRFNLYLMQGASELNAARQKLRSTDYYKLWTPEDIATVIGTQVATTQIHAVVHQASRL
jgi:hypothetical protein